jgi:hypothetical protein
VRLGKPYLYAALEDAPAALLVHILCPIARQAGNYMHLQSKQGSHHGGGHNIVLATPNMHGHPKMRFSPDDSQSLRQWLDVGNCRKPFTGQTAWWYCNKVLTQLDLG